MLFLSLYIIIFKRTKVEVSGKQYSFIPFPAQIFKGEDQSLFSRISCPSHLPKQPLKLLLTSLSWQANLRNIKVAPLCYCSLLYLGRFCLFVFGSFVFSNIFSSLTDCLREKGEGPSRMAVCLQPVLFLLPSFFSPGASPSFQITLSLSPFLPSWPTFQELKPGTC